MEVPAQVVMERFRLLERIGSGGMGTVYRAYDQRLEREVAIKEIDAAEPARVMREAQAAARLNHPAIATLYELGERRGRTLLVSELVEGVPLDRAIRSGGLSDRDLARIGLDLCEALAHAHERGVVHRDVKPANVIVRDPAAAGRRAKLMDFGIASVSGWPTMSATGEVVGTLAYMSPEQAEGLETGPACDIYSLALTLYEGWAGTNPVARATPAQTARRIGRVLPPLERRRPDLPRDLTETIDACLDPDPIQRPATADLGRALGVAARRLDATQPLPAAGHGRQRSGGRRASRVLTLAAIGTLLALIAGPLGFAGVAIAATLIAVPAIAAAPTLALAALPFAAIPLGLVGLAAWYPALVAVLARDARTRAILGALGFAAWITTAIAAGAGNRLGIAPPASPGWERSLGATLETIASTLTEPAVLAGAAAFAAAAVTLGLILRTPLAIAFVGAMIWAASADWLFGLIGDGRLATGGWLVAGGAAIAVAIEAHRRAAAVPPRPGAARTVPRNLEEGGETRVLA